MDAIIVTFEHEGRRYNVWVFLNQQTAQVNVRSPRGAMGDGWIPIEMDGGTIQPVEVQP